MSALTFSSIESNWKKLGGIPLSDLFFFQNDYIYLSKLQVTHRNNEIIYCIRMGCSLICPKGLLHSQQKINLNILSGWYHYNSFNVTLERCSSNFNALFTWVLKNFVVLKHLKMIKGFQANYGYNSLSWKVNSPPKFWKWTRKVLVPGLYSVRWYNGDPFEYEEGFISNRESFMVGMPRLRQSRIIPGKRSPSRTEECCFAVC